MALRAPVTPRRAADIEQPGRRAAFILVAAVVGAGTGMVAASFKLALVWAGHQRLALRSWAQGRPGGFLVFVAACGLACAVAGALVRHVEPNADGSGIPRVEAILDGRTEFGSWRILPVKFVGGVLAIGSGLVLGREGPLVQMGGNVGISIGKLFRRNDFDIRVLVAAGAGAGLATTFNAPIAGGVFVLEELLKRFDPRTTLATLTASSAGFLTARLLTPDAPELHVAPLVAPRFSDAGWVLACGVVCGLAGVVYNRLILGGLEVADRIPLPLEARTGLVGVAIGAIGWFGPQYLAGGDVLTDRALQAEFTLVPLVLVLLLRVVTGVVSYAAGTPGGLFAPQLVLGSQLGLLVGLVAHAVTSGGPQPAGLALVGMAAFFAATVQAPVTGLVLAAEMTQATILLPPMLGACAASFLVAQVLRCPPIYDSLALRAARR